MFLVSSRAVRLIKPSYSKSVPWSRALACDSLSKNEIPTEDIMEIIAKSQVFCFDVDSTVIAEEGIDQLASFKGVGQEVADLTSK